MADEKFLAERFQEHRGHLTAVAYRMLGSLGEADDAIQEAWLRASKADHDTVQNYGGWLRPRRGPGTSPSCSRCWTRTSSCASTTQRPGCRV